MKRPIKAVIAGRILLPIALLIGCSVRINAISLLYFLLLLSYPFVPSPTTNHVSWLTVKYVQCVMGAALSASLAQLIFHICILATRPYSHHFLDCGLYEKIVRQFGFQRWDEAYSYQITRLIFPEILLVLVSIFTFRMYKKKSHTQKYTLSAGLFAAAAFTFTYGEKSLWGKDMAPPAMQKKQQHHHSHLGKITAPARTLSELLIRILKSIQESVWWAYLDKASCIILVCASGIAHPNLLSFSYFTLFLILANLWILSIPVTSINRNRLVKILAAVTGVHLFLLYFYQFDFVQEFVNRRSIGARLFGLTAIYMTDCADVRAFTVNPDYRSSYLFHLILLGVLYRNCVIEICEYHRSSFQLIVKERDESVSKGSIIQAEIRRNSFIRRRSASLDRTAGRLSMVLKEGSHAAPHSTGEDDEDDDAESAKDRDESESDEKDEENAKTTETASSSTESDQPKETVVISILDLRKKFTGKSDVGKRIRQTVRQYSYVGCLVGMMVWSVTYHSWMTFVLLMLACIIWMVPNPRQFCLRITPYLVCYAEVLLIFEYIYGLDLTEDELPSETMPLLHQIGFVKPIDSPAWAHLLVKICYTAVFWLTLKAYMKERRGPARTNDGVRQLPDVESGRPDTDRSTEGSEQDETTALLTENKRVEEKVRASNRVDRKSDEKKEKVKDEARCVNGRGLSQSFAMNAVSKFTERKHLLVNLWLWCQRKVRQVWIIICCMVLLFISLRQPVVAYTIVYMAMLQTFINVFMISFRLWRKFLKYFWTLMIVYSMCVLTLIYTYQFRKFPEMWHDGTGWSYDVLESLGLVQYSPGELLMKLLTPISFLICTIIQLKLFHKQLMKKTAKLERILIEAEMRESRNPDSEKFDKVPSTASIAELEEPDHPVDEQTELTVDKKVQINDPSAEMTSKASASSSPEKKKIEVDLADLLKTGFSELLKFFRKNRADVIELTWRFLELHIFKVVALQMLAVSIREVSAIHLPYPIFVAVILPKEKSRHLVYKLAGVWTSIIIFSKMVFQMKFVNPAASYVNCSTVPGVPGTTYRSPFPFQHNTTADPSEWAGFRKSDSISAHLQPYFLLLTLLLLQELVRMRQTFHRTVNKLKWPTPGVLFEHITRREADDGLLACLMYFVNYFFYKFGVETCYLTSVITIGLRCDFVSVLYGVWLLVLLNQRRRRLWRIWRYYVIFLAVILPLQYLTCVGIPPSICTSYPWSYINQATLEWLYLPDFTVHPSPVKLAADFVQLLFACCQLRVFEIECGPNVGSYPGGDNTEIVEPLRLIFFKFGFKRALEACKAVEEVNVNTRKSEHEEPVADFISYPKSYLDLLKILLFQHLYWVTLTMVFVAGVSRVTLFAMGYVLAGFLFLWVGDELFLKPLPFGVRLWNLLILYSVVVILIKTSFQVIGCVFLDSLYKHNCWILQLFGIACLKSRFDPVKAFDEKILADCKLPTTEAGIIFDAICLCFLFVQRRIMTSRYFTHAVTEFRAQHSFANRGAELIHKIRSKQIWERQALERELVSKIKEKMEKIKEAQKKIASGEHGDDGQEGSSKQADHISEPSGLPDLPSLINRTNRHRRRRGAVQIIPVSSPTVDHLNVPESRDWLSPLSAFNESMVSSFHKSVTFSPSTSHRATASSLPVLNVRSPDDVSSMDHSERNFSSNLVLPLIDDANAETALEPMRSTSPIKDSDQLMLRYSNSVDSLPSGSTSCESSTHIEPRIATPELPERIQLDHKPPPPVRQKHRSLPATFPTADTDKPHRYRASVDVESEAHDAFWELELQEENELVPENEEDRRKGLGPLQLLNVAFKKGAIKAAVEDAKEMEEQEEQLKKQMTADFGKADKKAIKEALRKRVSTRILPDFEEDTFDPDKITAEVAATICRKRSGEMHISFDDESPVSHDDETEEEEPEEYIIPIIEENEQSPAPCSPEPEQRLGALLAQTFLVRRILAIWSALVEFLNNTVTFLNLFLTGVLESAVAWLLKISREYRYVAHALSEEKKTFKSEKKLIGFMSRGPSFLNTSVYRKTLGRGRGHGHGHGDHEIGIKRKRRGLSFYDRKLAEEEAKKFNTDRNVLVRLFSSTYYVLLSRSELFCYLMMVLCHMASASMLTMPLPVMAFAWGTLSVPKPTRRFWIAVIAYTEAIVIMKYLFQFGFFPWNRREAPPSPFFPPRILGIERQEKYAAWELALLMMLFFHRSNLKTLGLWKERREVELDRESMSSQQSGAGRSRRMSSVGSVAFRRRTVEVMVPPVIAEEGRSKITEGDEEEEQEREDASAVGVPKTRIKRIRAKYHKLKARWKKVKIGKWVWSRGTELIAFFKVLVNPRFRCSIDVYALMFLCDFICFVIVIFGYWAFGTETSSGGIAAYFEENKIPGPFLAMLVVQFVLIIIDRALFLRKHLLGKVTYQIGLVLFVHIWMFFILPAVTDRQFVNNTPAKLWYFVKCIYFCLSAWQIRSGYPTRVLGNMLTKKYNYLNMLLFKGFMVIPFLFELRSLMDWIWTDTSMSLSDWLKLEDIYANIYLIKCERQIEEDYPTPRGVKRRPLMKYGWGGTLLFFLILIIWFPLVLFSLANTVGIRSLPVDVTVKLTLGTYPPLLHVRASEQSMTTMSEDEYEHLQENYGHSKMATAYMSDYSEDDVVRVRFSGDSDTVWGISPPAKTKLIQELNSTESISLKFEWHFAREPDAFGLPNIVSDENLITLRSGDEFRSNLAALLGNGSSSTFVDVPLLYPPYVKVPGRGRAGPVRALIIDRNKANVRDGFTNVTLHLVRSEREEYWRITNKNPTEASDYLQMIGFVDKVFPSTFNLVAGGGILGFYIGLVLVVGKFVRGQVTGAMSRIMFEELPNVDRILQLCLDIFLVRESGELTLEEDLFAKLIFIYRSPATLIKWTKVKKT